MNRPSKRDSRRRWLERGMTLVEIMVVITILGLIAGAVGIAVINQLKKAKIKTARGDLKTIDRAIEIYMTDNTDCPPELDELVASGELKKHSLEDPWGQPYQYQYPGSKDPSGYDLWSNGPDKKPGTEDDIGLGSGE